MPMSHRELHDLLTILRAPAVAAVRDNADDATGDVFAKVDYLYLGQWMDASMRKMLRQTSKTMQEMIDKNTPVQSKVVVNELWFNNQLTNERTATLCKKLSELQKQHPITELVMIRIQIQQVADVELLVNTLAQLTSLKHLDLSYSNIFQMSKSRSGLKSRSHKYDEETRKINAKKNTNERRVCEMIFKLFQHNSNLQELNLRHTMLSDEDALHLVTAVQTNTTLVELNIEDNGDERKKCVRSSNVGKKIRPSMIIYDRHISTLTWDQMLTIWKHKPSDLRASVEADDFSDEHSSDYDSDTLD